MTNMSQVTWQIEAKCAGKPATLFFFEVGAGGKHQYSKMYKEARSICMGCGVAKKCYDFAVDHNEEYGVWGGVNFAQRHKYGKKYRANMLHKQHEDFMKEYTNQ